MINSIPGGMRVTHASVSQVGHSPAVASSQPELASPVGSEGAPLLSSLSRQLAASASRAEVRDRTLDRQQLGDEARRLRGQIMGDSYEAQKSLHNSEVPDTDDQDLSKRAEQATEYLARFHLEGRNLKNPFAELSREQLNLIVHDEHGPYTINERRAAYYEINGVESKWNKTLWGPADIESAMNDGRTPGFYTEVLNHYKTLPLIEQADYPEEYETRLLARIKEDSDPNGKKPKEFKLLTLFEVLAKLKKFDNQETADEASPAVGATSVTTTSN
ncbi:hypothetical protein AABC73_02620 [Pseudomonas sp. G.S.17]|uniref:hypothetical protein n=1 Tax=Pseudomonas sp. G.S.17 TaxID=3137451 RepID=UPI00311C9EC9